MGRGTPFAEHRAPSPAACARAVAALSAMHGPVHRELTPPPIIAQDTASCGKLERVLDALVATILSQNTTQKNSTAAMAKLMATFGGDYQKMRRAGAGAIAQAIYQGGLSATKSRVILGILQSLPDVGAGPSLEHLRALSDDDAKAALIAFDGVGAKTASCVLLFCLNRESFAVDTHVHRIARRLNWVPRSATRDQAHDHLEVRVPAALKYPLHVLLVSHGKTCPECAAKGRPQRPPLGPCPLRPEDH
jgi:endonuclease-3